MTEALPPVEAPAFTPGRVRAARLLALAADALQIILFPLFGEGFASPLDDLLDVAVAGVLIKLLGFHWALLPAAAAELVPGVDLAPTWTASVLLITAPGRFRWWIVGIAAAFLLVAIFLTVSAGRRL
jgi:hypothetical protein